MSGIIESPIQPTLIQANTLFCVFSLTHKTVKLSEAFCLPSSRRQRPPLPVPHLYPIFTPPQRVAKLSCVQAPANANRKRYDPGGGGEDHV